MIVLAKLYGRILIERIVKQIERRTGEEEEEEEVCRDGPCSLSEAIVEK